ncbi:hypothetical protein PISS_a1916 [Pseudoalteromonas issachenkonii]|uniref:Uncharacterized protein n=1 Tax=Pseudoalteromonas issachenkonii TaxID=152297 RepID=A0ABN5C161_9GAMM|nr:hypothetical protein PISS_a1916 [Pseudoalteromonas issachenkonii]
MSDASLLFKLALLKIIKLNDSNVLANLLKLYKEKNERSADIGMCECLISKMLDLI